MRHNIERLCNAAYKYPTATLSGLALFCFGLGYVLRRPVSHG